MTQANVRIIVQPVETPIGPLTLDGNMAPTRENPDGVMLNRIQASNSVFQFLSLVIPDFPLQTKIAKQRQRCDRLHSQNSELHEKVSHNWYGLRFLIPSFCRLADELEKIQDAYWNCEIKFSRMTGIRRLAMAVAQYSVAAKDAWPRDYSISGAELLLACDRALEYWAKDLGGEVTRLSAGVKIGANPFEDRADQIEEQAETLYR